MYTSPLLEKGLPPYPKIRRCNRNWSYARYDPPKTPLVKCIALGQSCLTLVVALLYVITYNNKWREDND